jgi:hypothetical protein
MEMKMKRWLYPVRLAALAMLAACAPAVQQTAAPAPLSPPADTPAAPSRAADPRDVASPQAVVAAIYEVISGPATQERDWDRYRTLFLPDARLAFVLETPSGQVRLINVTVDEFIRAASPGYRTQGGFWERDIGQRVNQFGTIAHVFSAYETRRSGPDGAVAQRGINSVQMLRHEGRWWITNAVFDMESAANPIPPEYLGSQNP